MASVWTSGRHDIDAVLIVTNFAKFPQRWTARDGTTGRSEFARNAGEFLKFRYEPNAVFLVNSSARLTLDLVAREALRGNRRPIIAVDLILRKPGTVRAKLSALLKRAAFEHVDYFVHYFKDLRGLESEYGISAERSCFVPFKANLWAWRAEGAQSDGSYALCFGRSLRDFDTFFDAIQDTDFVGAIVDPYSAGVWEHGSRFTRPLRSLPRNVLILEHDQTNASQAELMRSARIVVVPMLRGRLVAAGISTILNAMILGKCVIATAGVGVTDLFDRELVSIPPEDPRALRAAIATTWQTDHLRRITGQAGWEYALRCGSEDDFYQRLLDSVVAWIARRQSG